MCVIACVWAMSPDSNKWWWWWLVLVRVWHIHPSHLDDAARPEPRSVDVEFISTTIKFARRVKISTRSQNDIVNVILSRVFCYLHALICIYNIYVDIGSDVVRRTQWERPLTATVGSLLAEGVNMIGGFYPVLIGTDAHGEKLNRNFRRILCNKLVGTRSSAIAERPCDAKACQG